MSTSSGPPKNLWIPEGKTMNIYEVKSEGESHNIIYIVIIKMCVKRFWIEIFLFFSIETLFLCFWRQSSAPQLWRAPNKLGLFVERNDAPPFSCIHFESLITYVGTPMSLTNQPMQIGWLCLDSQIWSFAIQNVDSLPGKKKSDLPAVSTWPKCTVVCAVCWVMRSWGSTRKYFSFPNWADEEIYFWVLLCRRISFPLKSMALKVPHLLVLWWAFFPWEWISIFHRWDLKPLIVCTHVLMCYWRWTYFPRGLTFVFMIYCFHCYLKTEQSQVLFLNSLV